MNSLRIRTRDLILFSRQGNIRCKHFPLSASVRKYASKKDAEAEESNEPIKFSTSRAAKWSAEDFYRPAKKDETPWIQAPIVSLSIAVFLIYFCVFREESGVDKKLDQSLYDHIEGLEEKQLELAIKYHIETGQDTKALRERLQELRAEKQ